MKISICELKDIFAQVLNGSMTREEADRWAYSLVKKEEDKKLFYFPSQDKEKIWAGIMYLYGVDLQDTPNSYLHSNEDIAEEFAKLFGQAT